jgi:poly-gamma-glutamate capsule biosynthesis protein CapA/YwtB (metallophosphatase superfamily)
VITLFLCGDVMTGRGIDQILPHPGCPHLYESYMTSALGYVELAERANGPIPKPVDYAYPWGDALEELDRAAPDVRIINLETSVTTSETYWDKGINYRMHPANTPCLAAAKIDCCMLANNHVLDWGAAGLEETLDTLMRAKIKTAGAGRSLEEAQAPAVLDVPGKGRVLVFRFGSETSGILPSWAAGARTPGVNHLPDLSAASVREICERIRAVKRAGDLVVASIHWGANWGYLVPDEQRAFAYQLIGEGGVDVVHGHSSHHVKAIEVHRGKPILYGCGDFMNDYEGIEGHEAYRSDLAVIYLVDMEPSRGTLKRLRMIPLQRKRFRLGRASREDALWLRETLSREGKPLGTRLEMEPDSRAKAVSILGVRHRKASYR